VAFIAGIYSYITLCATDICDRSDGNNFDSGDNEQLIELPTRGANAIYSFRKQLSEEASRSYSMIRPAVRDGRGVGRALD